MGAVGEPDHEASSSRAFGINFYSLFFGNGKVAINEAKDASKSPFNKNISRSDSEKIMLLIGSVEVMLTGDSLVDDTDNKVASVDASDSN